MKNFKKILFSFLFFLVCFSSFSFATIVQTAQAVSPAAEQEKQVGALAKNAGFADASIGEIAATIIEVVLSLLGVIFVGLLVFAGFQWMTAGGNEEKVEKARNLITRAIIGLIIVVAAYSITFFVFNALNSAVGGG
jgi:hypothetical protein